MCIACELGYLSMLDALEAERNALREQKKTAQFVCETDAEPATRENPPQSVDEPAP
jgi:hypothetical protein